MFKKTLKRTGIILGSLIVVLLIANAIFVWRGNSTLQQRLQAIRNVGDPILLADLDREPLPPEKNAAVYYRQAEKGLEAIGRELDVVRRSGGWPDGLLDRDELQTIDNAISGYPDVFVLGEEKGTQLFD